MANTFQTGSEAQERQLSAEALSYNARVISGGQPVVPTTSLTIAAFATEAFVPVGGFGSKYVSQAAAVVTITDDPLVWLALHHDTTTIPAGWTRVKNTHYIFTASATQPVALDGVFIIARIVVAGSIITVIDPFGQRFSSTGSEELGIGIEIVGPVWSPGASTGVRIRPTIFTAVLPDGGSAPISAEGAGLEVSPTFVVSDASSGPFPDLAKRYATVTFKKPLVTESTTGKLQELNVAFFNSSEADTGPDPTLGGTGQQGIYNIRATGGKASRITGAVDIFSAGTTAIENIRQGDAATFGTMNAVGLNVNVIVAPLTNATLNIDGQGWAARFRNSFETAASGVHGNLGGVLVEAPFIRVVGGATVEDLTTLKVGGIPTDAGPDLRAFWAVGSGGEIDVYNPNSTIADFMSLSESGVSFSGDSLNRFRLDHSTQGGVRNSIVFFGETHATPDRTEISTGQFKRFTISGAGVASTPSALTLVTLQTEITVTSNQMTLTGFDGGGHTIVRFNGGLPGQTLTLFFEDTLITLADNTSETADTTHLTAGFTSGPLEVLVLERNLTSWRETSRRTLTA